jgi:hypothetical protein
LRSVLSALIVTTISLFILAPSIRLACLA